MNASSSNSIDLFSTSGSGDNYHTYRPKYPNKIINKISELNIKSKQNYLDIASGTGQLFFDIFKQYSNLTCANDLSEIQLNSLISQHEKSKEKDDKRQYLFIACDALELNEKMKERQFENVKYDLITIAEAFHWLNEENLLNYIKNNLLKSDGVLFITSYYYLNMSYVSDNEEFNKKGNEQSKYLTDLIYQYRHEKLKSSLDTEYINVKFKNYYTNIEKDSFEHEEVMNLSILVNYLSTWSFYHTYLNENKEGPDPLQEFKIKVLNDFKELNESKELKSGNGSNCGGENDYNNACDPKVKVMHKYFYYSLSN